MISIVILLDNSAIKSDSNAEKAFDDSITSVINQTYKEWELKIVLYNINENDNNSTQNITQKYKDIDGGIDSRIDGRIDVIKYYNDESITLSKILFPATCQALLFEIGY